MALTPEQLIAAAAENNNSNGGNGTPGADIRWMSPSERYSTTKSAVISKSLKQAVVNDRGREVQTTSELERAYLGAWLKHRASKSGISNVEMTDHDTQLVNELADKGRWVEWNGNPDAPYAAAHKVKALLNDNTSGGAHVVPEIFDELLISFPLVNSEIVPLVDLRPLSRGLTVAAASVQNHTMQWGTASGTSISIFDTAALVDDIDTTIHPVSACIECGSDFLQDSPAAIGAQLEQNIGQRMLAELDRVIALGNGTTEPEGVFTASGLGTASPENTTTGPPTVADFEELMFAIGKQYLVRRDIAFLGNQTSYQRARGIAVGSSDQRRVFGMDELSWKVFELPFAIQGDIPNGSVAFGNWKRYRLYRRQGAQAQWYSAGTNYELGRANKDALIVRARYGGRVVDANAFATWTNGQS